MIARLPSVRRLLVLLVLGTILVIPATAGASTFPDTIRLPDGWQPEGIASGRGTSLYVGSIPTGAVWKGDARTGRGDVLVPGQTGRSAIGIKVDKRNRLFVAGGGTGKAFVYDARTGRDLASYQLAAAGAATFVNDVAVTSKAAWFTDSRAAQLYALPLGRHGKLPGQDKVRTLALKGDFQLQEGNNLNGIVAAKDGRVLRAAKDALNGIDLQDVRRSYRLEQGYTFELNLAGVADEHRDEFVETGKPRSNSNTRKG